MGLSRYLHYGGWWLYPLTSFNTNSDTSPMSRSRSGCATCKRRHRKCDETKPSCLQCQAQNIVCEGYDLVLRWDAGIPSQRRSAGTLIPVPLPDRSKKRRRIDEVESQLQDSEMSPVRQRLLLDAATRSNSQSLSPGDGLSTGLTRGNLDASPAKSSPQSLSTVDSPQTPTGHHPWPGRTERERFLFKQCTLIDTKLCFLSCKY